jgi:hypothetical protein
MKRFIMVLTGGLGATAFWRRRRHPGSGELEPDPAAELRARLDANKASVGDRPADMASSEHAVAQVEEDSPAPAAVQADTAPADPASLRAAIHQRARGAIDDLR